MATCVGDIFRVYGCPVRFFEQLDLARPSGRPFFLLILLLGLFGYAVVAAGLVEHDVDLTTERSLALIEKGALGDLSRDQLNDRFKSTREAALFWKVIASGGFVLAVPVEVAGRILAGATVAFVMVALSGRKPAYYGLVAIFTFAAYTELLRQALVVPLMLWLRSTEVETSLAVLLRGRPEVSGWLFAGMQTVDPFSIWFCCLVAIGINRSGQLSRGRATALGVLLWLGGAVLHVGMQYVNGLAGGQVST